MQEHTPNAELARRLGVSEATVSRLRSGQRMPSPRTMAEIEKVFRWSKEDQADLVYWSHRKSAYSAMFNRQLKDWVRREMKKTKTTK